LARAQKLAIVMLFLAILLAATSALKSSIEHVIAIMYENRPFDHLLVSEIAVIFVRHSCSWSDAFLRRL
jgi:hypothetical protein